MRKQLYRTRENRVIAGVCGGTAEYLEVDPTIVRLIWVLVGLISFGLGVILYIVAAIIIPEKNVGPLGDNYGQNTYGTRENQTHQNAEEYGEPVKYDPKKSSLIFGGILILLGSLFLAKRFFVWIDFRFVWPVVLIIVGAVIIFKGRR